MIRWITCRLFVLSVASYIRSSKDLRYDAVQQFGLSTGFVDIFLIPDGVPLPIPVLHVFGRRDGFSVSPVFLQFLISTALVRTTASAAPLIDAPCEEGVENLRYLVFVSLIQAQIGAKRKLRKEGQ